MNIASIEFAAWYVWSSKNGSCKAILQVQLEDIDSKEYGTAMFRIWNIRAKSSQKRIPDGAAWWRDLPKQPEAVDPAPGRCSRWKESRLRPQESWE